MTKLTVAFQNSAKALKNGLKFLKALNGKGKHGGHLAGSKVIFP